MLKEYHNPLISIIIAVYNNEKYLSNSITSVLDQEYSNYEIIIIDDGSTDNTRGISDDFAQRYSHIKVIHQTNQWIYASFNRGIKEAKGEYIFILNSDDVLIQNSLKNMVDILEKYNYPDVVYTRVLVVKCDDELNVIDRHVTGDDSIDERFYGTPEEIHRNWCFFYENDFSVNQANLYRRELMLSHPFRNDVYGADTLFNISIAEDIKSCVVLPEPVYRFNMFISKRNTSVGKYYDYEHAMFTEFYTGHRKLLEKWGFWNDKTKAFLSKSRIYQVIQELRSYKLPGCKLSNKEIIRKVLNDYDDTVRECADCIGRAEEIESRFLFSLHELVEDCGEEKLEDIKWVRDLTDDFIKYSPAVDKQKSDLQDRRSLLTRHPDNPNHLGRIFYDQYLNNLKINTAGKKKVLWLCNLVIPELSAGYGMKQVSAGSWISGMLREVSDRGETDVALVFPIYNVNRMRDGYSNGHRFFSFHYEDTDKYTVSEKRIERFKEILSEYQPDVVHIWGTEYPWALEMISACEENGIINKCVVYIQGLVSLCGRSYRAGVPEPYYSKEGKNGKKIKDSAEEFVLQGRNELKTIQKARRVIGRTDWDHACVSFINADAEYYNVREILRNPFYENSGAWKYSKCIKHRIFVSQASYPLKGFHYLEQALPAIVRSYPDTEVFVGGEDILTHGSDPYSEYLTHIIDKNGIEKHITFLGRLSDEEMLDQYMKANVFVSASSMENSSNSVCEAMIIGVPVVSSFVGGMGSFIEHGRDGFLYPEREIELLAYYINKLFGDGSLCKTISGNAVEKAEVNNSREIGYRELMSCYREIINNDKG